MEEVKTPRVMTINHSGGEFLSVDISGLKKDDSLIWPILDEAAKSMRRPSSTRNIGLHVYDTDLSVSCSNKIFLFLVLITLSGKSMKLVLPISELQ